MSSWLIPSLGLPVAMTTGRLVVLTLTGASASPDRAATRRPCRPMLMTVAPCVRRGAGALRSAGRFLKNEVFEICGALALAESVLARLGLSGEAADLAAVFDLVRGDWWTGRCLLCRRRRVSFVGQRERVDAVAQPVSVGRRGRRVPGGRRTGRTLFPCGPSETAIGVPTMVPSDLARSKLGHPVPDSNLEPLSKHSARSRRSGTRLRRRRGGTRPTRPARYRRDGGRDSGQAEVPSSTLPRS